MGTGVRLTTRPATDADFEFLRGLHHKAYQALVTQVWGWDDAVQDRLFLGEYDPSHTTIVHCAGRDVGAYTLQQEGAIVWIVALAVLPDAQGRGLGSAILRDSLATCAREGRECHLGVLKVNERARRLYERIGFVAVSETETSIIMACPVEHS